jgi:hypothetical protein
LSPSKLHPRVGKRRAEERLTRRNNAPKFRNVVSSRMKSVTSKTSFNLILKLMIYEKTRSFQIKQNMRLLYIIKINGGLNYSFVFFYELINLLYIKVKSCLAI